MYISCLVTIVAMDQMAMCKLSQDIITKLNTDLAPVFAQCPGYSPGPHEDPRVAQRGRLDDVCTRGRHLPRHVAHVPARHEAGVALDVHVL